MFRYLKQSNILNATSFGLISPLRIALLFVVLACNALFIPTPISADGPPVPGDIIVADFDGFGEPSTAAPGNIFKIDVESGALDTISQEGLLADPFGVAVESDGNIIVAEFGGPGSIVRINPLTGDQSVLTFGENLNNPVRLAIDPNGDILVVDNSSFTNHLVRVDRTTGVQTVVARNFNQPTGVAVDDDGDIFVTSREDQSVIQVDPETGDKTPIASGAPFVSPSDVAIESDGSLIVADFDFFGDDDKGIFRVNPLTGDVVLLSDNFDNASGVAIDANGDILVADLGGLGIATDGTVVRVDPITGETIETYNGGGFVNPNDVDIFLTQVKPVVPDTISLGPRFDVRIDATNALDLTGGQFNLEYDSSLLSFVSARFDDEGNQCYSASNDEDGILRMAMTCESGRTGTSTIWNLEFEADGTFSAAETEFRLTNVFLNDSGSVPQPIPSRGVRARSNVIVGQCGDIVEDSFVNVLDAIKTLKFVLAPGTATETQEFLADTNRNGTLEADDASGILGNVVGAVSPLRCGPLLP